ncbi:MAG: bifunctional precorrin-2 dehydrogenase/sirohydrochlorin ferrochelatase [Bacteroidetes bacterium]|nr:bifunctional precorrin-2 dehydrogenase/sirohydrochlorin ferrochelatase [Bacteroidota bacterium]
MRRNVCVRRKSEYIYFPVLIDLRKFPCLVVGGGKVALRKVRSLLEFNAKVTVVSPRLSKGLIALSTESRIRIIRKPYSGTYIGENKLVFSATDNREVNLRVSEDCKRKGVLLNVADGPAWCDFILPANVKRGSLIVSVSSQGKAPFFARDTKKKLAAILPASAADVAELAGEFRRRVLSTGDGRSQAEKDKSYKKFLSTDWERILATKGKRKTYKYLEDILRETVEMKDN